MDFQEAKDVLQGESEEQKRHKRFVYRKCDWDDDEDVLLYRRQSYAKDRRRTLDRLVPSRICPSCSRNIWSSRSWVVNRRRTEAICRSCFFAAKGDDELTPILETVIRCRVDGEALRIARERAGISQKTFADEMGWSQSYQTKLESGSVVSVSIEVADQLLQVLNDWGVVTPDAP